MTDKTTVKKSNIAGKGLFAKEDIKKGSEIGVAIKINPKRKGEAKYSRTKVGRYINDSTNPNARLNSQNNKAVLIARRDIKKGEEILADYTEAEKKLSISIKKDWRKPKRKRN